MTSLLLALAIVAQQPDRRGEVVLTEPTYKGVTADAPIPTRYHIQNEGGSDRAGLCVIASGVIAGAYHDVGDLRELKQSELWKAAKKRPGGYWPEKLDRLVKQLDPEGKKYPLVQDTQADSATLDKWSREGRAIGVTMNTGANYGYRRIAHMVTGIHYRQNDLACIVDNNFPGRYSWMPAAELDRRRDGWAYYWNTPAVVKAVAWLAWWPVGVAALLVAFRLLAKMETARAAT